MDDRLRNLERRAELGDLDAERALASLGERTARRLRRLSEGHLVAGPLLAQTLAEAFAARGAREVELLRAAGIPEHGYERWIRALRDLIAGRPRSWVWVERWAAVLGEREQLPLWRRRARCVRHGEALAALTSPPPDLRASPDLAAW